MTDRERFWVGVIVGIGIVLLYFPAGNNSLFLVFGAVLTLLGIAVGTNLRRVKAPGIEIEYFRFAKRLRERSAQASDAIVITEKVEAVVIRPEPAAGTGVALPPTATVVQPGQAMAEIAAAVEKHPPESPEQLADQVANVVRDLSLARSTAEALVIAAVEFLDDFIALTNDPPTLDPRQQSRFSRLQPDQLAALQAWREQARQDVDDLLAIRQRLDTAPAKVVDPDIWEAWGLGQMVISDLRERMREARIPGA